MISKLLIDKKTSGVLCIIGRYWTLIQDHFMALILIKPSPSYLDEPKYIYRISIRSNGTGAFEDTGGVILT